jgi:hypothetical protein
MPRRTPTPSPPPARRSPPDAGTEVSVEVDPALAAVVESLSETGTA